MPTSVPQRRSRVLSHVGFAFGCDANPRAVRYGSSRGFADGGPLFPGGIRVLYPSSRVHHERIRKAMTRVVDRDYGHPGDFRGMLGSRVEESTTVRQNLEALRRSGEAGSYLFAINHSAQPVSTAARGDELVMGAAVEGVLNVPAGQARVVREESR
jgi:hypothetical protein